MKISLISANKYISFAIYMHNIICIIKSQSRKLKIDLARLDKRKHKIITIFFVFVFTNFLILFSILSQIEL